MTALLQHFDWTGISAFGWALRAAVVMLVLAMLCTAARLWAGPNAQDRILALDCMYLNGMLLILVFSILYESNVYFEAAILIALLACVSSIAMAKFLLRGEVIE